MWTRGGWRPSCSHDVMTLDRHDISFLMWPWSYFHEFYVTLITFVDKNTVQIVDYITEPKDAKWHSTCHIRYIPYDQVVWSNRIRILYTMMKTNFFSCHIRLIRAASAYNGGHGLLNIRGPIHKWLVDPNPIYSQILPKNMHSEERIAKTCDIMPTENLVKWVTV